MDWKTIVGFTVIFHGIVYAWRREWILRLDTRKFNPYLNNLSQYRIHKFFIFWFRIGSFFTIVVGFPFTVWLFLRTLFYAIFPTVISTAAAVISTPSSFFGITEAPLELHHDRGNLPDAEILSIPSDSSHSASSSYLAIQPILPGWNLPLRYLPYYLIAILISVVIHELSHAVASTSHRIPIIALGFSLFGPLIPTAHVELNSAQLKDAPIKKQLDILTAGVWMNFYLSVVCYFVLPYFLPTLLWPTHSIGNGISVTGVAANSGAGGPSGFIAGDIIMGIETCKVKNLDTWLTCLEQVWDSEPVGYCLTNDTVSKLSNNSEGCCANGDNSATHLCFTQMSSVKTSLSSSDLSLNSNNHNKSSHHVDEEEIKGGGESETIQTDIIHSPHSSNKSSKSSSSPSSFCLPAKSIVFAASLGPDTQSNPVISTGHCFSPKFSCPHIDTEEEEIQIFDSENTQSKTKEDSDKDKVKAEDKEEENVKKDKRSEKTDDAKEEVIDNENLEKQHNTSDKDNTKVVVVAAAATSPVKKTNSNNCYVPRIVQEVKSFRIVQIHRRQSERKESVLFVGDVYDLANGVRTTEYVVRDWFLSRLLGFGRLCMFPVEVETVLLLTAGLSAGLAVVNMLPIFHLDGYHVLDVVIRATIGKSWEGRKISRVVNTIAWITLVVALLTIFCSVIQNF